MSDFKFKTGDEVIVTQYLGGSYSGKFVRYDDRTKTMAIVTNQYGYQVPVAVCRIKQKVKVKNE